MIHVREPGVKDVIGLVDGVAFATLCGEGELEQSKDYNAYRHDAVYNNVLAFDPDCKTFFATIRCAGSSHDSTVPDGLAAWAINDRADLKLCVVQGFPEGGALIGPSPRRYEVIIVRLSIRYA